LLGVGRLLTEECVRRAQNDGARFVALEVTPAMEAVLGLFCPSGFTLSQRSQGSHSSSAIYTMML
jgi:ribosomal protein S18 acetylase RimI-like enzyme